MCVATLFLALSFIIQSNSKRLNVSTRDCDIHGTWDANSYEEFEIFVKSTNNTVFFHLNTNDRQFIYRPTEENEKYEIIWIPLTNNGTHRERVDHEKETKTVVFYGCRSNDAYSTAAPELQFYEIYFWISLVTLPVLVISNGIFLYVCLVRRNRAFKRIRTNTPLSRPAMDVSSSCYDNSVGKVPVYDEVRYSLVKDTRL